MAARLNETKYCLSYRVLIISIVLICLLTGDKEIGSGTLLSERGRVTMDRAVLIGVDGTPLVNGLSNDVDDSAESLGTNGHHNR
jgi:hypothetical protein